MGQLQRQLLDLQLAPLEFGIALGEPGLQGGKLRLDPLRQRRLGIALGQFGAGIHALNYTIRVSRCLVDTGFPGLFLPQTRHSSRGLACRRRQSIPQTSHCHSAGLRVQTAS